MQTTEMNDLTNLIAGILQTLLTFLLDFLRQGLAAFLF